MRIENRSALGVQLFRNAEDGDRVSAFVLAAITYDVRDRGLAVAAEQLPLETDPALPYPHDAMVPHDRAASVCATGFVYPPSGRATEALARLTVGDVTREVLAIGTRVWQRGILGVSPTSPLPFERVPMTWDRAFGGRVKRAWSRQRIDGEVVVVPGLDAAFPPNPEGLGFYLEPSQAFERPLPMLEDPARRVEAIDDWPDPVCFAPYPLWGALRAEQIVAQGATTIDRDAVPRLVSRAAPALTFDRLAAGTEVHLDGMRPGGRRLAFKIPHAPIAVLAEIGPDRAEVAPRFDSIHIDAETARVRFVFRASFAYDLVRRERRTVTVEPIGDAARLAVAC